MGLFDKLKEACANLPIGKGPVSTYTPPTPLTYAEAKSRYGDVDLSTKKWANEVKFMTQVRVPEGLKPYFINAFTKAPTSNIYINKDIAPALVQALSLIDLRKLHGHLKSYDGCLNVRVVRGTTDRLSTHSYGLAIDINANGNGLGETPSIHPDLVKCFTDAGWTWGGNFSRKDGMHFQIARGW